uniref:Uncharacterized protein n=1 Tax=Arundo donax TaxID=35708 RepID=A0A0A9E8C8_ARUDO
MPKRSCRKSLGAVEGAEVVTGASSELKSSKSAKGAGGGFATPFGSLSGPPAVTAGADFTDKTVACVEAALFTK